MATQYVRQKTQFKIYLASYMKKAKPTLTGLCTMRYGKSQKIPSKNC